MVGIASGNAANMQSAMMSVAVKCKLLVMNCFAHTAQLLLGDVLEHWGSVLAKADAIESFFRRGYPKQVYEEEMGKVGGTLLRMPSATRWGSCIDMLQSVVKNNTVVDHALGRLRREKFRSPEVDNMAWVWVNQYWDHMDQILQRLVGLREFIAEVEADTCTLGDAVHRYLELRGELEQWVADLSPALAKNLNDVFANCDAQFLKRHACAAYFCDARYRAEVLTSSKVRETIEYLHTTAWPLFCDGDPPPLQSFTEYQNLMNEYARSKSLITKTMSPTVYWVYLKGLPLAAIGECFAGLPSSTGSVERLWSACGFLHGA